MPCSKSQSPKRRKPRYAKKEVIAAIKDSGGIISNVAKRLACDWHTADAYIKKWEDTKKALSDETETLLDFAESRVIASIQEGDITVAKWYLTKKGRSRGYDTSRHLIIERSDPLNIVFGKMSTQDFEESSNIEIAEYDEVEDDV